MTQLNPQECLILVIDDVKLNFQLIQSILEYPGYQTIFAQSGKEALELIGTIKPDLILLDLRMPEMDGLEVCEKIQEQPSLKEIPIIFVSASPEKQDLLEALDRGAVDYITKPFHPQELLARVKIHLSLKYTRDQLAKALQELEKIATTDPLTGVANRRHFFLLVDKEFARAKRYQTTFSLLMLDIDRFKKINDSYGHPFGDQAIQKMTLTVINCLRNADIFARYGGEEFIICLPQTDISEAMIVAERIRVNISNILLETQNQIITITVSIGVTSYKQEDSSIDEVLSRADKALYKAKETGRNRVFHYLEKTDLE